ncbi:MAG: DUF1622 domain-containing protein, partial [Thermomicrobiales bacterium]
MDFENVVEIVGKAVDGVGVGVIVVGAVVASVVFLGRLRGGTSIDEPYRQYRKALGRAILLGLEFLVAGDIIRTVAIEPTFRSVGILAVIVVIRTFLSVELEMEIEGRWPWDRRVA